MAALLSKVISMRIRILIPFFILMLLLPLTARAINQDTLDRFEFLLMQPEWDMWGDGLFDDNSLIEGLGIIFTNAENEGDDAMVRRAVWAMGETGLVAFAPTIIGSLESEPVSACFALGKIPSTDGVYALIDMLDNDDMQVRDAAVWGLGNVPYNSGMSDERMDAIVALNERLLLEEEDWVLEDVEAAIVFIEAGVAINEAFMDSED